VYCSTVSPAVATLLSLPSLLFLSYLVLLSHQPSHRRTSPPAAAARTVSMRRVRAARSEQAGVVGRSANLFSAAATKRSDDPLSRLTCCLVAFATSASIDCRAFGVVDAIFTPAAANRPSLSENKGRVRGLTWGEMKTLKLWSGARVGAAKRARTQDQRHSWNSMDEGKMRVCKGLGLCSFCN